MSEKAFDLDELKKFIEHPKLGELLIRYKKVSLEQLGEALEIQKTKNENTPVGQILIDMKVISENELVELLSLQSNIDKILHDSYSELEKLNKNEQKLQ